MGSSRPGGLELVQDLVNARPVAPYAVRDLLGTVAVAQRFTTGAGQAWKEHSHAIGGVRLQLAGTGVRWLASAVWGEVLLSQRDGRWERLKVCRNSVCPCAFYDRSRNNSRVWHDVTTCGNVANLRASCARRRAATG